MTKCNAERQKQGTKRFLSSVRFLGKMADDNH